MKEYNTKATADAKVSGLEAFNIPNAGGNLGASAEWKKNEDYKVDFELIKKIGFTRIPSGTVTAFYPPDRGVCYFEK